MIFLRNHFFFKKFQSKYDKEIQKINLAQIRTKSLFIQVSFIIKMTAVDSA